MHCPYIAYNIFIYYVYRVCIVNNDDENMHPAVYSIGTQGNVIFVHHDIATSALLKIKYRILYNIPLYKILLIYIYLSYSMCWNVLNIYSILLLMGSLFFFPLFVEVVQDNVTSRLCIRNICHIVPYYLVLYWL